MAILYIVLLTVNCFAFTDKSKPITIIHYAPVKIDGHEFKGKPVVFNFTGSDNYLRFSRTENVVNISVMVSL